MLRGQHVDRVDAGGDIVQRHREPTVAALTHPAELEVPCGVAPRREVVSEWRDVGAVVQLAPEAAVKNDDDRVRPVALRQVEIADLVGVRAVGDRGQNETGSAARPRSVTLSL